VSDTLTPVTAVARPCCTSAEAGAVIAGGALTATAMLCTGALPPRPSLAFTTMLSEASVVALSARVARSAFTSARLPLMVSEVVPELLTVLVPVAVANNSPDVSVRLTVSVSPALIASASDTLTPFTAVPTPCCTSTEDGAVIAGAALTATAMLCGAALPPRPSPALITMLSAASVLALSARVARSAFTSARLPLMVSDVVPELPTVLAPVAVANNRPDVSVKVTVSVSPALAASGSDTLTPFIAVARPCCTSTEEGAVIAGGALTATAMLWVGALPPRPSPALMTMLSAASVLALSARVARSAFTSARLPLMISDVVPELLTVLAPVAVANNSPDVSVRVTVRVSLALVASASDTLTPFTAVATPCCTSAEEGAVIAGGALTETVMLCAGALPPRLSLA
jgi:hypothetical protein